MNAIEQFTEIRPVEGGQVRIRVSRAVTGKGEGGRASQEVIRIQVEDNVKPGDPLAAVGKNF